MPEASSRRMPPPFDEELGAAVPALRAILSSLTSVDDVPQWRTIGIAPLPSDGELSRGGAFEIGEHSLDSGASVVVCRPNSRPGPVPVLYHLHGGGMIRGTGRSGLLQIVAWASHVGAAVVSVDYRLAPENPYPAPVKDCFAGLLWIHDQADNLGFDASTIIMIGVSAGGGLAAATALLARDRGGPLLAGQMLLEPMLDHRNSTFSSLQMKGVDTWDREMNRIGWSALLGSDGHGTDVSRYASPGSADDLSGLPPTFIDVGSAETFRDEAIDYAERIWRSGGDAELHVWAGGFHGYSGHVPGARVSQETRRTRLQWIRRRLAVASNPSGATPSER